MLKRYFDVLTVCTSHGLHSHLLKAFERTKGTDIFVTVTDDGIIIEDS